MRPQAQDGPETEARGRDRDPRNEGVGHKERDAVERQRTGLMEDGPERAGRAEVLSRHPIGEVVQEDDEHGPDGEQAERQPRQEAERDHRPAERPEDGQEDRPVAQGKVHRKAQGGEFEQDEPEAALDEEGGPAFRVAAAQPEESTDPGREEEDRGAEVRDPAREEEGDGGPGQVLRRKGHGAEVKEVPGVVEGHEDHDQAAQGVHGPVAVLPCGETDRRRGGTAGASVPFEGDGRFECAHGVVAIDSRGSTVSASALILSCRVGQGKALDRGTGALRIAHREPCRDARPGSHRPPH